MRNLFPKHRLLQAFGIALALGFMSQSAMAQSDSLAKIHGIFGQLTFAFAAVCATACSRWWQTREPLPSSSLERKVATSMISRP